MEVHVRVGATKEGKLRAIDVYTFRIPALTASTAPLQWDCPGHKSIPLYRDLDAFRFAYDVVYTNHMSAGGLPGIRSHPGNFRGGDGGE